MNFRTVTFGTLQWRGLIIQVTLERNLFNDRLQIETLEPFRASLPVSPVGWLSRYLPKAEIGDADPSEYVQTWLDEAAKAKIWQEVESSVRQYALL